MAQHPAARRPTEATLASPERLASATQIKRTPKTIKTAPPAQKVGEKPKSSRGKLKTSGGFPDSHYLEDLPPHWAAHNQ